MAAKNPARPRVGLIGLGNMGRPMASRIAAAGHPLAVMDSDAALTTAIASELGATACLKIGDLASLSDVLVTMLPNGGIVAEVVELAAPLLPPDAVVVDMSSSAPQGTIALGEQLARRGIGLIDAPVSGGVRRAIDGLLAIIAGGPSERVERVAPLLSAMGSVRHVGALGAGHAMKALNNFLSAAGLAAACEVVIIAERFGIDPETAIDVLNQSTGRNVATETKMKQFVLNGSFAAGFNASLMAKDLRTASKLAFDLEVAAPLLQAHTAFWTAAAEELGRDADHTAIYKYIHGLRSCHG